MTLGERGGPSARVTTVGDLTADDFDRWRRLEGRVAEPYPYLSADYLEPADPHWPAALPVRLLLVEADDELLLVMPFQVDALHPRMPLKVLTTADAVLADEGVRCYPLLDTARGIEALRVAFSSLRSLGLPTLIDIAAMPADGQLHELIVAALGDPRRHRLRGRSMLAVARYPGGFAADSPGHVDVVPKHRSASTRKQARQRLKALELSVGAALVLRDRSDDPTAVDDFLDLQAAGWKGDSSRHGLAYRLTGRERWFREAAARFRAGGRFTVFELSAHGRPVYLALGLASGSTIFGMQDAYDEAVASYGIGTLGRTAFMNWLATQGYETFDPNLSWSYVQAARLFPEQREQVRLLVAGSGASSLIQIAVFDALTRARERVRAAKARRRSPAG